MIDIWSTREKKTSGGLVAICFCEQCGKTHEEDANAKICKWKKSLENYKIKIK